MAIDIALNTFKTTPRGGEPDQILEQIFKEANLDIYNFSVESEQRRMGTTLTTCIFRSKEVWIGHVGDCRVYLVRKGQLKRFVNISSFSVYTNRQKPRGRLLDESCPVETHPEERGDAYSFAKVKQDEIVTEYGQKHGIPYVIVRPGYVYGPGNEAITNRVGIGTFGLFLHLGGSNTIPFTYVDNCADAIVLAGLMRGVEGEVFNVVDDDLPSSRRFLRLYKRNVKHFRSLYLPHPLSYLLCFLWEKYSAWSEGQLPPAFNRSVWHAVWKKTRYTNAKLKNRLQWTPKVSSTEALNRYFQSCRDKARTV